MNFKKNVLLNKFNWFGTGGPAKLFCEPKTYSEFQEAVDYANHNNLNIFVLGEGANVLISDDGFDGLVIKPEFAEIELLDKKKQIVRADAGVSFDKLINFSLEQNLTGLEEFSGIPGSVGGAVYINIHFFDLLLSAFLIKAKVINSKTAEIIEVINDWFEFGYDKSKLQQKNFYLLNADFKIIEKDKLVIKKAVERRNEIIKYREERYPTEKTCGSFFRNLNSSEAPVQQNGEKIIHAAFYLNKLKGNLSVGGAEISERHANMIENKKNARSSDIFNLALKMKTYVKDRFGINLIPECQLVGFNKEKSEKLTK